MLMDAPQCVTSIEVINRRARSSLHWDKDHLYQLDLLSHHDSPQSHLRFWLCFQGLAVFAVGVCEIRLVVHAQKKCGRPFHSQTVSKLIVREDQSQLKDVPPLAFVCNAI